MKSCFNIFLFVLLATAVQPCFSSGAPDANTAVERRGDSGGLTIKKGVLMVGMEIGYPPMEYLAADEITPIGFDVDLAKALAEKMGLTIEFVDTAWDGIFAGVETRRYDCIISAVTITPVRLEVYNFSKPYIQNTLAIVMPKNSKHTVRSPQNLSGLGVAFQDETMSDYYMQELAAQGLRFTPYEYDKLIYCFDELRLGRVDAIMTDLLSGFGYIGRSNLFEIVWQGGEEEFGICMRKGNDALTEAVNKALGELFEDGTMLRISSNIFNGMDLVSAVQDGDNWRKERGASVNPPANDGLVVWSFTDEVEGIINNYYRRDNPSRRLTYVYTPTDQFESRLDPVLSAGRGVPDVFVLESAFVRKYVESGQLLDLTDIYERNKNRLLAYPAEIGTYNGRVYAMSWQASPGAMFYRRSLAKKYLGTDDPAIVQTYFTDLNKFMETAELLKQRSNGSCVVVSSRGELYNVFLGARKNPWVVNGRLVIDPVMERYMEVSKIINDNRYDARVGQWSSGWFKGMIDELINTNGRTYEVFSYFLPTWGLHYVLKTNTTRNNGTSTSSDWAMIQGPASWRWGGTWLGAYRNTPNAAAARVLIEYITTNDNFLQRYALDSGDMVANTSVVNRVKNYFSEPFLGGQNHYAAFAEMALGVNGRLVQGTDQSIESLFAEQITAYVEGKKTKAQALADFRTQVQRQLGLN
jgi:ABC-type amino acid transport substrate-binding protein/ABC-type glycerol-3-phosphate transport system substrate-binding protein